MAKSNRPIVRPFKSAPIVRHTGPLTPKPSISTILPVKPRPDPIPEPVLSPEEERRLLAAQRKKRLP